MIHPTITTLPVLIEAFGSQENLARIVRVGPTAVSNAFHRKKLPSGWFMLIENALLPKGEVVCRDLFNFRRRIGPRPDAVPERAAGASEPSQEGEAKAPPCAAGNHGPIPPEVSRSGAVI